MESLPAIELRQVSLSFADKEVLSNISLRVEHSETVILLGVTSSGKTVLLKVILGLLKPDTGEVRIEGQDIVPLSETQLDAVRRRMGMVFQEGALFDSLSVYENVAYRLREGAPRGEPAIERRVREVLRFVDLEEALDKMPAELSGGMRRRVSIARALAGQPSIMLYDSPTAGLDPVTAHTINVLIAKLRDVEHVSSIVVTHRLQDAFFLAQYSFSAEKQDLAPVGGDGGSGLANPTRFLILRDGQVHFEGSPQDLATSRDTYLRRFFA